VERAKEDAEAAEKPPTATVSMKFLRFIRRIPGKAGWWIIWWQFANESG
jgi:hypothetical protein